MGRKSRYSEYAKGMKKKADAKNAATQSHNKSIKDRLKNLKADFDKSTFDPKAAAEARKKEMDQMAEKLEAGVRYASIRFTN